MKHILRFLLLCVLVLGVTLSVTAQDGMFGLTADDLAFLSAANENSAAQAQFKFDYDVAFTVEGGGASLDVALGGSGQFDDVNEQLSITANGTVNMDGETAVLEGELRVVDEFIYARFTDPDTGTDSGWFSVSGSELENSNIDFEALGEEFGTAFAEELGASDVFNEDTLLGLAIAAMAINPEDFISASLDRSGSAAEFSLEVSGADFGNAVGAEALLNELITLLEAPITASQLAAFLSDTTLSVSQSVAMDTNLVSNTGLFLFSTLDPVNIGITGEEPASIVFTVNVDVSGYNEPTSVEAPADATEIPLSVIEEFAGVTGGGTSGGADSTSTTTTTVPAGGPLSVGTSTVVDLEQGATAELKLTANESVTITARALEGADPRLSVLDNSGNEIASNDDHSSNISGLGIFDSAIENLSITGPVLIRVSEFSGNGGPIEVSVIAAGATLPSGDALVPGTTQIVTLPAGGELSFPVVADGRVTISARALGGADTVITLEDSQGAAFLSNDDHGTNIAGLGAFDSALENVELPGGSATLVLSELGASGGDIEISVIAAGGATVPSGGALTPGSTQTVTLSPSGSVELPLVADGRVTITARALGGADTVITLLNPQGISIATNDDHGTSIPGLGFLDSALENVEVPGGTATLVLSEIGSTGGAVEITVTATGGGAAAPSGGALAPGSTQTVTLSPGGSVELPLSATGAVTVTLRALNGADTQLAILDSAGNEIAYNDDHGSSISGLSFLDSAVQDVEIPGSATVVISELGSVGGQIEVTVTGGAGASAPSGSSSSVGPSIDVASLGNDYVFPNDISFSYPDSYTVDVAEDILVMLKAPSERAFIQIYESKSLFGDLDMGLDFFKQTYGSGAASTWGFDFSIADFVDQEVNGRTLSVLEFQGLQNGETVIGAVVIVPYTSGYGYVLSYALPPAPENFIADTIAVAATLTD